VQSSPDVVFCDSGTAKVNPSCCPRAVIKRDKSVAAGSYAALITPVADLTFKNFVNHEFSPIENIRTSNSHGE
jgi:hypothetical protein